jgi:hypothetical protein
MATFEIDFHGPIAFRLCHQEAWAYLPICADHSCNILTDSDDISPNMHINFELLGPTPGSTKSGDGLQLVKRKWNGEDGPTIDKCYCIFKLPAPDLVFGLRSEYVKIEIPGEPCLEGNYARGLRFFYAQCKAAPTILPSGGAAAGDLSEMNSKHFGRNDFYQIEISYQERRRRPTIDDHHRDAMKCSRSMRELFPECANWKVSFEQSKLIDNTGGHHPVDCGANIIVFTDGIEL